MKIGHTLRACCPSEVKVRAARMTPKVGAVKPAPFAK